MQWPMRSTPLGWRTTIDRCPSARRGLTVHAMRREIGTTTREEAAGHDGRAKSWTGSPDDMITVATVGILAYASADIAHHVFGHAAGCLARGDWVLSVSSIFVHCTGRGAAIDLAGPFANLALGLVALFAARMSSRVSAAPQLFWILTAAFNLLWFSLQLVFSAATRTDDWAWAMHVYGITEPIRYALIVIGALAYLQTLRAVAARMVPFAHPRRRARRIVVVAWIMAGATAAATAAFDHDAGRAILLHALPQSAINAVGLLFIPARASALALESDPATPLARSTPWIAAAAVVVLASLVLLGPGVAIAL